MSKRVRWECPNGKHRGQLGPSRPRLNATIRYCLDCSREQGVLVERVAPSLERKRAAKVERRKTKAQRKREKAKEQLQQWPDCLQLVFAEIKKLRCWTRDVKHAELELRRYGTSRGGYSRVTLCYEWKTPWKLIETMMHELVHTCYFARQPHASYGTPQKELHNDRFHGILLEASEELLDEFLTADTRRNLRIEDTKYDLDSKLMPYYKAAYEAGHFDTRFGGLSLKAPPPQFKKRHAAPSYPPGQVRISISESVWSRCMFDDPTVSKPESMSDAAWDFLNDHTFIPRKGCGRYVLVVTYEAALEIARVIDRYDYADDWRAVAQCAGRIRKAVARAKLAEKKVK